MYIPCIAEKGIISNQYDIIVVDIQGNRHQTWCDRRQLKDTQSVNGTFGALVEVRVKNFEVGISSVLLPNETFFGGRLIWVHTPFLQQLT